jgi:hypothetical protein
VTVPLKLGEATISQRLADARLEIRRIAAAHDVALTKYNQHRDAMRNRVQTPESKAQEEMLLAECQRLWKELDEAHEIEKWYCHSIDLARRR